MSHKVVYSANAESSSSSVPSTPRLSNDDFRRLLLTPRGGSGSGDNTPSSAGGQTPSRYAHLDPNGSQVFAKPQKSKDPEKRKKKFKQKKKDDEQKSTYRDRAAERRDGKSGYEEGENQKTALQGGFHSVPPTKSANSYDHKGEIERSKFLGGDLKHTHLVKGLDYALLAKVKNELSKEEQEAADRPKYATSTPVKQSHTVLSTDTGTVQPEGMPHFNSHIGRRVYETLFSNQRPKTVDYFLPGRTMFVYELNPEVNQDIPTTVKRSKDVCPDASNYREAKTHPDILARITKIMVYYTQGAKAYKKMQKKQKKKEEEERVEHSKQFDDGDSIFDDVKTTLSTIDKLGTIADTFQPRSQPKSQLPAVGPQLPSVGPQLPSVGPQLPSVGPQLPSVGPQLPSVGPQLPSVGPQLPPVDNLSAFMEDAFGVAPKTQPAPTASNGSSKTAPEPVVLNPAEYYFTDTAMSKATPKADEPGDRPLDDVFKSLSKPPTEKMKEKKKDPTFVEEYSECYPATYEGVTYAANDSDEDEDLTKMDSRQKLKRWDFEDDTAWENYENKREALPKAAFQFGVKAKEGRQSKKVKDQKLKTQLKKIEGMIEAKEGGDRVLGKRKQPDSARSHGGIGGADSGHSESDDPNSYAARLQQKRGTVHHDEGSAPKRPKWASKYDEPTTPRFVTDGSLFK